MAEERSERHEVRPRGSVADPDEPVGPVTSEPVRTERVEPVRTGRPVLREPTRQMNTDGPGRAARLERDIEYTRAQMSETIDEIGSRLNPRRISHEVKQEFKQSAKGVGNSMIETIKENPIPAIVAGLSIGWLFAKGGSSSQQRSYRQEHYPYTNRPAGSYRNPEAYHDPYLEPTDRRHVEGYQDQGGFSDRARSMQAQAGEATQRAEEEARRMGREAQNKARHMADQAQSQAQRMTHEVQSQARHMTHEMEHQARRAAGTLDRFIHENPLASGAIALAAGAAMGMALPGTHMEDAYMGQTRDSLMHKAQSKAEDAMHRAEHVAKETAHEAKDEFRKSAQKVKETAKAEAQEQGMQHDGSSSHNGGSHNGNGKHKM